MALLVARIAGQRWGGLDSLVLSVRSFALSLEAVIVSLLVLVSALL